MKPHIGSEVNLLSSCLPVQWSDVKFIWNNSYLYCGCRWKWRVIIAVNKLTSLPMCGFIAQLVEHRTGIAEVTGSNPVEALIFFRLLLSNCLNWKFTAMITLHFQVTIYKTMSKKQKLFQLLKPITRQSVCLLIASKINHLDHLIGSLIPAFWMTTITYS